MFNFRYPMAKISYPLLVKPLFDCLIAFFILLISLPILLITGLLLLIANRGSIWFTQARPGLNEKLFSIIKFKTMTDERDETGKYLPDNLRLTWIGKFIRRTSIDELPQLINVVKGDMSLVGPRPLLIEYLPLYNEEQRVRHQVKPGITGLAQVSGRNAISWEERFGLDRWYVNNISFWLDLKILILTLLKVLKSEGINSATSSTMEKFNGSK